MCIESQLNQQSVGITHKLNSSPGPTPDAYSFCMYVVKQTGIAIQVGLVSVSFVSIECTLSKLHQLVGLTYFLGLLNSCNIRSSLAPDHNVINSAKLVGASEYLS